MHGRNTRAAASNVTTACGSLGSALGQSCMYRQPRSQAQHPISVAIARRPPQRQVIDADPCSHQIEPYRKCSILGAGDEEQASNHLELLPLRAVAVSVAGKGGTRSRQVRSGETSASEPLMTCRNSLDGVETRGKAVAPGMSLAGALRPSPNGARLGDGVNPDQALLWNAGTCRPDAKGQAQAGGLARARVPMRGTGREQSAVRDEGSVMELD